MDRFGAASGVQLTGIGKTALAGRIISRLRDDGWLIAVHDGTWNPAALITAAARAISDAAASDDPRAAGRAQAAVLREAPAALADPGIDDGPKLAVIARLLAGHRLLLVFDDFEQNLAPGGGAFLDPTTDQIITALADAADTGGLLVTCRYPLPGPDRFLVPVPVPALSGAELRRLFLRLPALHGLDAEDQRLLTRTIGGHPRLIEFADALLRGGRSSLRHVQGRLRDLARNEGVDLTAGRSLTAALDQVMLLGSADILLTELTALLTPRQAGILLQVAACQAPMTLDDLSFTLTPAAGHGGSGSWAGPGAAVLEADVARLADLTLLTPGDGIVMHPWTADLVTRNVAGGLGGQHERALAMRYRRFEAGRGSYDDLLDIPRHLAALGRYDAVADHAAQAVRILPGTLATVAYLSEIRPRPPPTPPTPGGSAIWNSFASGSAACLAAAPYDVPSAQAVGVNLKLRSGVSS